MDCKSCKDNKEKSPNNVPYIVYEASMARQERQVLRLWVALIVAIIMIFASNGGWLIYQSQYDTVAYTYDQSGAGNNIIGNNNEADYNGSMA